MVLLGFRGGWGCARLVDVRIERHARLIDPRDTGALELLPHFALDEIDAVVQRLGIDLRGIDVREPRQIIERVGETRDELRLRAHPGLRALLRGALAKVVVLGGQAQVAVFPYIQLWHRPLRRSRRSRRSRRNRSPGDLGRRRRWHRFARVGIGRRSAWRRGRQVGVAFVVHDFGTFGPTTRYPRAPAIGSGSYGRYPAMNRVSSARTGGAVRRAWERSAYHSTVACGVSPSAKRRATSTSTTVSAPPSTNSIGRSVRW